MAVLERSQKRLIERFAASEVAVRNHQRLDAGTASEFKPSSTWNVRDDDANVGRHPAIPCRAHEGLHIGSPPGNQHGKLWTSCDHRASTLTGMPGRLSGRA